MQNLQLASSFASKVKVRQSESLNPKLLFKSLSTILKIINKACSSVIPENSSVEYMSIVLFYLSI